MHQHDNNKVQKFVDDVANEIAFSEARDAVRMEMRTHLEDGIETARSYGLAETDSIQDSLKRMGDPRQIGMSLNLVHKPKFDFLLLALSLGLCLVGLWNLSATNWVGLQSAWIAIGLLLLTGIYLMPLIWFRSFLSSLYILAVFGIVVAYASDIESSGQPYLSIAGLNIKVVDLSAILFALALPTLSSQLSIPRFPALSAVLLFLFPLAYFSLNGFIWAGLLLLVSGLCFLGMQKISNISFLATGTIGAGLLLANFSNGFVPVTEVTTVMATDAHTDYVLRSLTVAIEFLAVVLLIAISLYGFREVSKVKEHGLRSIAVVGVTLMAVQFVTSVLAIIGVLPMISAGVNVPFVSYGGSGIIANFLVVGVLLACLKRKTLSAVAA